MAIHGGAGRLDRRIRIQRLVQKTVDGAVVDSYVDLESRWADIQPVSAQERFESDKHKGFVTHKVRTRYMRNATGAARLRYGDRVFHVEGAITNGEDKEETVFFCVEEV